VRILLVQPPWAEVYGGYRDAARIGNAYPPLGLCYLGAVARRAGHDVCLIDAEAEGKGLPQIVEQARRFRPDLVGITATSPIFDNARALARALREAIGDVITVLGGAHATVLPQVALEEGRELDLVVFGEGESTFEDLLAAAQDGQSWERVAGLAWRRSGEVILNRARGFCSALDRLPWPDRSLLDLDRYTWGVPGIGVRRFTTVMTSRGCPFGCIFCSQRTVFGRKVRFRSPENILAELEEIVGRLGIRHVAFIDDTLTLKRDRIVALCEGILARRLELTWEGWTRAEYVDEDLMRLMRRAGFVRISFGIESGDPAIQRIIRKNVRLDRLHGAYRAAKRAGIETRASAMLGHPTETWTTALRTIRFVRSLKDCDQLYLNVAVPYPGTPFHEMARSGEGGIRLLTEDLSAYRRYGEAVIDVNNLSRERLALLQRLGFMAFYFTPRRVWYNMTRAGLKVGLRNALAFARGVLGLEGKL
jgi:radical SAM superfamily enzyme YgiQ (UPF0313 family)